MRIVIVGAGAIGGLFGALLARGGHEVVFIDPREEVVAAINRQGVGLSAYGSDPDSVTFITARAVSDASGLKVCDGILLTVKAFDTRTAMRSVAHLITQESPIITLQTALGSLEVVQKVERRRNVLGGFTFMAAVALGPGRVRQGGWGGTCLGELDGTISPRAARLSKVFNDAGIEAEAVEDVLGRLWCKAIIHAAINPVSAILRVKNGRLLEKMESISLMKRLVDEGRAVATACGIELHYDDLYELLFESCRHTADHASSMLQDILDNRRTEIDYLNGALCRYGTRHSVAVPTHRSITELVRLLEKWGTDRE
jgi:2-dehydropantoate 2-reductase